MSNERNIHFTFNFNAPVGQNIAHVDKLEAHFDKDMTMQVVDTNRIVNEVEEGESNAKEKQENEALTRNQLLFNTHEEQREWAEMFVAFLKRHKMMDPQGLTKVKGSFINRALACFMHEWQAANILKVGHIDKAPSYFLFHSCNIRGTSVRTHGNECKNILKECFEQERNSELHIDVMATVKDNL